MAIRWLGALALLALAASMWPLTHDIRSDFWMLVVTQLQPGR